MSDSAIRGTASFSLTFSDNVHWEGKVANELEALKQEVVRLHAEGRALAVVEQAALAD